MYDTEFLHPEQREKSEGEKAADRASGKALWPDLQSVAELKAAEMAFLGIKPGKTTAEENDRKKSPDINVLYGRKLTTTSLRKRRAESEQTVIGLKIKKAMQNKAMG